jgi:hypothetical protein
MYVLPALDILEFPGVPPTTEFWGRFRIALALGAIAGLTVLVGGLLWRGGEEVTAK